MKQHIGQSRKLVSKLEKRLVNIKMEAPQNKK